MGNNNTLEFQTANIPRVSNRGSNIASYNIKDIRTTPVISNKIYICFSSKKLCESKILNAFSRFGKVEQIEICTKWKKGAFTYGFLAFESIEGSKLALQTGKLVVEGVSIRIKPMGKETGTTEFLMHKNMKNPVFEDELNYSMIYPSSSMFTIEQSKLLMKKLKKENILKEWKKTAKDNTRIHLILKLKHKINEDNLLKFNVGRPRRYQIYQGYSF